MHLVDFHYKNIRKLRVFSFERVPVLCREMRKYKEALCHVMASVLPDNPNECKRVSLIINGFYFNTECRSNIKPTNSCLH